jgi:hypothetical protein
MNEEVKQEKILSWDEALTSGGFVSFESGVRKKIAITAWKLVEVTKPSFDDKSVMVTQPEFQAKTTMEDDKPCEKTLGMLSKRFMGAVKPILEKYSSDVTVTLSVKRIGEGNGTNYDVEEVDAE